MKMEMNYRTKFFAVVNRDLKPLSEYSIKFQASDDDRAVTRARALFFDQYGRSGRRLERYAWKDSSTEVEIVVFQENREITRFRFRP